jgi:5-methylcytosine-specific restriction endonuclease McrA
MTTVVIQRGPGAMHEGPGPQPKWAGRKSTEYVKLTLSTYGTLCWLCGLPGATSADHIIPRSRGGAVYNLMNLGPTHKRCNESRGNTPADVYRAITTGIAWFDRE